MKLAMLLVSLLILATGVEAVPQPRPCVDKDPSFCEALTNAQKIENCKISEFPCPLSCGLCVPEPEPSPEPGDGCTKACEEEAGRFPRGLDKHEYCKTSCKDCTDAKIGLFPTFTVCSVGLCSPQTDPKGVAKWMCVKTCGLSDTCSPEPSPEPSPVVDTGPSPPPPSPSPPPSPPPPSPKDTCTDEADFTCKASKCTDYSKKKLNKCKKTCELCEALPPSAAPPSAPEDECAGLKDKKCKIKKCEDSEKKMKKCRKQCKKKNLKKKCKKTCCKVPPSAPPPSLPPALKCAGLEDDKKCKIKNCADNAGALKKCEKLCKKKELKTKCQKTCCDLSP